MAPKNIFKSRLTWLVIFIVIGIIAIVIISKADSGPQPLTCIDPEIRYTCDGSIICGPKCPDDQYFNCTTKKCDCKSPNTLCEGGTVCCEVCDNDICCSEDRQISVDGKVSCCAPGTSPDKDTKTQCLTQCGIEGGPCGINQTCNKLSGLTKERYDAMIEKHSSEDSWRGSKWDDISKSGEVYFCSDPPMCMWQEAQALPHSIGDAYFNYDMGGLSGEGFNSLCLPKEGDTSCYGKSKATCDSTNCDWVNVLDSYSKDTYGTEKKLNAWNEHNGRSVLGSYCGGNDKAWGRLEKAVKDPASTTCKWQDCYNRLANTGTIDIDWNEDTATCSALKTGNTNSGIQSLVKCKGPGDPCSSCVKADEYANCIQCNGQGNPCKECNILGQYVPSESCTSTDGWKFEVCKPNDNNVLRYDPTQTSENMGNCPWGCNDPTSQDCKNTITDAPMIFGQTLAGTSEVCYNNSEIQNYLPNYWRAQAPPSAKACSEQSAEFCQNPGKSICTRTKEPCGEGEAGCYSTQTECEQRNTCQPGWLRNNDKTDCNIFMCTADGSLASRDVPAGVKTENASDLFHVNSPDGTCFRTNPKVNANDRDYCRDNGLECKRSPASEDKIGKDYSQKCTYNVTDCQGMASDTIPRFKGAAGGPEYKFAYTTKKDNYRSGAFYTIDDPDNYTKQAAKWGGDTGGSSKTASGMGIESPPDGVPKYT